MKDCEWLENRITRWWITATELKMLNLSLPVKCSFSKINSAFFFPGLFYSVFISTLLEGALKNFKRMLLVHCFNGFFCFLNWYFKVFVLNWCKNLRAQFGLYRKRAGVWTPWNPPPIPPQDARLKFVET